MVRHILKPPPLFSPRGLLAVTLIVAAILLLFALLPAGAQEASPPCQPPDVAVADIAATHPLEKMIVLEPQQASRVGVWFDAQPPESKDHFDFVVVLRDLQHNIALLLGKDGQVCKAFIVPDELMPALLAAIMGTNVGLPIVLVQHAPEDMEMHNKFYQTWLVPNHGNARVSSCCSNHDCAQAEITRMRGHWYGRRSVDPDWILLPDALIESNQGDPRESPPSTMM